MNSAARVLDLHGKRIILIGTAHVSADSVEEVRAAIRDERPDQVCVEIDAGRFATMTEDRSWEKLDIVKVLKDGKGFLLLANLVLSSFQRRMGKNLGIKPGDEMKAAVEEARALGIAFTFCDREVQTTLRRAWSRSSLWNKSKLLASLLASTMSNEALTAEEIEELKSKSVLDEMMGQLASYLPSVKVVLIDERDRYLATKIFQAPGRDSRRRRRRGIATASSHGSSASMPARRRRLSDIDSVPPRRHGARSSD